MLLSKTSESHEEEALQICQQCCVTALNKDLDWDCFYDLLDLYHTALEHKLWVLWSFSNAQSRLDNVQCLLGS